MFFTTESGTRYRYLDHGRKSFTDRHGNARQSVGTLTRMMSGGNSLPLRQDGESLHVLNVLSFPARGESSNFILEPLGDGEVTLRTTSNVTSVEHDVDLSAERVVKLAARLTPPQRGDVGMSEMVHTLAVEANTTLENARDAVLATVDAGLLVLTAAYTLRAQAH